MDKIFSKIVSFKSAIRTVVLLSSVIIVFHFLILFQIISYENVWAGKLKSIDEMYVYESISILINCLLIVIVLIKGQTINPGISPRFINMLLWVFVLLFALNTLGNLASKQRLETVIATPIAFVFAFLCLRIVTDKKAGNSRINIK